MKATTLLALAASGAAILPAGAQARVWNLDSQARTPDHRAALGVSTTASGTLRDTLGLMIMSVTPGSPAERAGLEEGNRIAAINGVSLRANAADIEDAEASGSLSRRLVRELAKAKPGDEVELRVYRDGRTSSLKVRTADADSLFRREPVRFTSADADNRPVLGFTLGSSGSRRDTLGVLVISVDDSTPAARAGLEEGNRIAAINGVNLRVAGEDAGDPGVGASRAQRLQREIRKLTPGSDVTLRVYSDGRFRDVRMKVARAGDLPHDRNRMMILGGADFPGMAPMAPMPPMAPGMMVPATPPATRRYRVEMSPELRTHLNEIHTDLDAMGPELEKIGPALEQLRPQLERMGTELPRMVRVVHGVRV